MEGGVGLFLLLVLLVAAIGIGIALYVTGGSLLTRKDEGGAEPRGVVDPVEENTTRMRTGREHEHEHRS
jgi:hypothetical protein